VLNCTSVGRGGSDTHCAIAAEEAPIKSAASNSKRISEISVGIATPPIVESPSLAPIILQYLLVTQLNDGQYCAVHTQAPPLNSSEFLLDYKPLDAH
jgi:hypothetical protein